MAAKKKEEQEKKHKQEEYNKLLKDKHHLRSGFVFIYQKPRLKMQVVGGSMIIDHVFHWHLR